MNNRFETNLNIIESLKKGIDLKNYSGFGGLNKIMSQADLAKLKDTLGDNIYQQIIRSCKTAYYTPTEIIELIYHGVEQLGFKGGRILEPACGHGAFIFNMPKELLSNSIVNGVELERLSARIAKIICPYASIANTGFEKTLFKVNTFDAIFSNPPYGSIALNDPNFTDLNGMILHHFFVAKSVYLLKQGGIMAMVLPQYCFDNVKDHPRHIMADHGSLIAAFRLPDCMFDNAKVTVDVVFYVKDEINDISFQNTKKINVKGHMLNINEYYLDNPDHILGELDTCNMYGRKGLTVTANNKNNVFEDLYKHVNALSSINLPSNIKADFNLVKHLDNTIVQLSQELAHQSIYKQNLINFEIDKLRYLKNVLADQQRVERDIKHQINHSLKLLDNAETDKTGANS